MLQEASAAGLLMDRAKAAEVLGLDGSGSYAAAAPNAVLHESLKGWWRLAEFIFKRHWNWTTGRWEYRMNLGRRRTMPAGALVHESAYLRGPEYQSRLPADAQRVPLGSLAAN